MPLVRLKTLKSKSGILPAAAFSGNPKVASVAFGSPFDSVDFSVIVDIETTGNRAFVHAIQSKTVNGFVISLCANDIAGLDRVTWQAQFEGEE
jgi:hypothetical protein